MPTPPMLDRRTPAEERFDPDPVAALAVLLLSLVGLGLAIGGVVAVYDWRTPGAMWPLVDTIICLFAAVLAILCGAAAIRWARTGRPR